jgi:Planctomycete cytochrome C
MQNRDALLLLLCAPMVAACVPQVGVVSAGKTDGATDGAAGKGGANSGGNTGSTDGPRSSADMGPSAASCDRVSAQAMAILQTNCAYCHQNPAKMGNFDFILNVEILTVANSTAGTKFVLAGSPEQSRIYQRVSAGEMPPAGQMPRPSAADVSVLRDWIARCVVTGQPGPGGPAGRDAGAADPDAEPEPPPGCGDPGQPCCDANTCNGSGCCVVGLCRGNNKPCGDGPGGGGLLGMCINGSCVNGGVSCGGAGQGCCTGGSCTTARVYCADTMKCDACGALAQPCCGTGGGGTCNAGLDCQGDRFPLKGSCRPCGAMGQPCCGNGPAVGQVCNARLTCRFVVNDAICQP